MHRLQNIFSINVDNGALLLNAGLRKTGYLGQWDSGIMYIMIVRQSYKRVSANKRPDLLCVLHGQALLSIQCHIFTQETESPKETV